VAGFVMGYSSRLAFAGTLIGVRARRQYQF
jgi:hypothetical protein